MYGDTGVMRRRAQQLREQGADLRLTADQLVARAESLPWTGRAADAMRGRVRERAGRIRDVATRHETAAESLERHLHEVEVLKAAIDERERRAARLLTPDDGRTDGSRAAGFDPPPTGHKDWLGVDLPGL